MLAAICMLFLFCSCSYRYEADQGRFKIMYGSYFPIFSHRNPDGPCVYSYVWDGDKSNADIIIPDEYDSQPIKKLGGYFGKGVPKPFQIDDTAWLGLHDDNEDVHSSGCVAVPQDEFDDFSDEWSEIVYHDFDLYIGKNTNEIYGDPCAVVYTVDGVKTAYCPRVTVHCDENNETFYSKDGKLYFRKSDKLVEEFIYSE